MFLPQPSEGGNFAPPPSGSHPAVCYRVIDLGTQDSSYQGESKRAHKVMLSWEIADPDLKRDDGEPFTISQRYTLSMHPKAMLRQHLEAWRGKAFEEGDFGPGGFDMKKLLGVGCYLSIVHQAKGDKTYANISALMKLPKGVATPQPKNDPVYLALTPDRFDRTQFAKLHDKLQDIIRSSPEYRDLDRPSDDYPTDYVRDAAPPADFYDDPIPF